MTREKYQHPTAEEGDTGVLSEVLYMTSVRVRRTVDEAWNRFYDDWVTTFTEQVPGTRRGSRWRVTNGVVDGNEVVPVSGWPMYLATEEYDRLDEFVLSRSWRKEPQWAPRVRSFDPWFKELSDYATLNLQKLDRERGDVGTLPSAILSSIWTVDPKSLQEYQQWRTDGPEKRAAHALSHVAVHHYLAELAQLHRHGGPSGELVIPQRHHFEDGGRLCYVSIIELEQLPTHAQQTAILADLQAGMDEWAGVVADRQDVFAERILVVDR